MVRFLSIRNSTISFVFMLAISDVNSAGLPTASPTDPYILKAHQLRSFLFSDHKAPDLFLCLSSPPEQKKSGPVLFNEKKKKIGKKTRLKCRRPMLKVERKYVKVTK